MTVLEHRGQLELLSHHHGRVETLNELEVANERDDDDDVHDDS
jgi:hypothetical protein